MDGENHRDITGLAAEGVIAKRVLDGHRGAALVSSDAWARCPIHEVLCRWNCIN